MIEVVAKLQVAEEAWKTDVEGTEPATWQSAGTPLEAPDRNSQSPEGAVPARQGAFMWRGRGEEENGGQGTRWVVNAFCGRRKRIRRQWQESWTKWVICMRWLQNGKEKSKQGRLMLSAGKPLETSDRKSQSPEGAVQRTSSSARGIHVARRWRGGERSEEPGGIMYQIIQHVSKTNWCIHNPMQNSLIRLNGRKIKSTP